MNFTFSFIYCSCVLLETITPDIIQNSVSILLNPFDSILYCSILDILSYLPDSKFHQYFLLPHGFNFKPNILREDKKCIIGFTRKRLSVPNDFCFKIKCNNK